MSSASSSECFFRSFWAAPWCFRKPSSPPKSIATIRRERVSVLVAVPRMLQSLKEKIERDLEDAGQLGRTSETNFARAERQAFPAPLVDFPPHPSPVRMEVLGLHLRRRRPRPRNRRILGTPRLRRHPGLRPDRNHLADQRQPSFPPGKRLNRKSARRARSQAGARWRNPGSRRRRRRRILAAGEAA